ncbi:MAG: M24 family metallopeptidase [Mucilaginibacter sp.]
MNDAKQKLALAEKKAKELFDMVEGLGLIVPGKSESELAAEVVEIARKHFGIEKFWHKKIVRTGPNTINSYSANPLDLVIQKNDILFLDFGPIFEGWEADLGRTYVLGNDPLKLKLKKDVESAWHEAKAWYDKQTGLTGAAYFIYLNELAAKYGWEFGGEIGGHIVGHFPHEQLEPDDLGLDVHPDNHSDIFQPDKDGNARHWILEIQFVDRVNNIGAFFEQLIN